MVLLGPNHLGVRQLHRGASRCARSPSLPRGRRTGRAACRRAARAHRRCSTSPPWSTSALSYLVTLGKRGDDSPPGTCSTSWLTTRRRAAVAIFMETVRDPELFHRARQARRRRRARRSSCSKAGSSALSARTAAAHTGRARRRRPGHRRDLRRPRGDPGRLDRGHADHGGRGGRHSAGWKRPGIGIVSISGGACDHRGRPGRGPRRRAAGNSPTRPARGAGRESCRTTGTVQKPARRDRGRDHRPDDLHPHDPRHGGRPLRRRRRGSSRACRGSTDGTPYVAQRFRGTAIGEGMRDAACPTAFINQVLQPITDYTRSVMARAGVSYVIPGLRQAIVALAQTSAWWSEATRPAESRPLPATVQAAGLPVPAQGAAARPVVGGTRPAGCSPMPASPSCPPGSSVSAGDAAKAAAGVRAARSASRSCPPQILHKTDIGGVLLDVPAEQERGA